jgi:hypothetical protein
MKRLIPNMILWAMVFTHKIQAEPIKVRPTAPIYNDTTLIGFSSTDQVVEFKVPDSWVLKKDGVIKRSLNEDNHEIILQVEPSYSKSEDREQDLLKQGIFKVMLPIPVLLNSAELYVNDIIGDLKAEFVPYPGNSNTGFYFRLALNNEQLDTLFKLSLSGLSLLGEVDFELKVEDFAISTTAPIKVSIFPWLLNPSYSIEDPWMRDFKSDNGQGGGIAGNGICDGSEICAFREITTGKIWISMKSAEGSKNALEWSTACGLLSSAGYRGMRLPTKEEVQKALAQGMWNKLRSRFFYNEWWWGTRTKSPADGSGNSWWVNIDSGNTFPLHDEYNKSDRSVCVSDER